MISVIMPIRNAGPFLKDCLDSIRAQTYSNWELIAVNDHSTDETESILKQYSAKDARIKWFQNKGKGIIPALQTAYHECNGAFISRMDADDLMPAQKLHLMRNSFDVTDGHVCTGLVEYFSDEPLGEGYQKYAQWLNSLSKSGQYYAEIYKECVIPSAAWMLERDLFEEIGGFSADRYPEDYDLAFRMYAAQIPVVSIDRVLHRWRDHQQRASRNDPNYADNNFLDIKVHYFLQIDHQVDRSLFLWGAGTKGKRIAQLLIEKEISFDWVTDNQKKIGHDIYGVDVQPTSVLTENCQVIIAIAAIEGLEEIRRRTAQAPFQVFWFS